jgi:RimJ/RimL family protein N-acetyltransferase
MLRPLTLADAPALFIALSDPTVQKYRRGPVHADIQETHDYIADTLQRSRAAWTITQDAGEALGRLALRTPEPDVGEFGIVIRRTAQRLGLGRVGLSLAEGFAFGALELRQLRADIDAENAASLALFERLGFRRERTLVGYRRTKPGLRDSVILVKDRPAA